MSKFGSEQLLQLVHALTSSEKRSFRLYVDRLQKHKDKKFIQLYDWIIANDVIDDNAIVRETSISKLQLANTKLHLKQQLLKSLLLNPKHQTPVIELREEINYASVLYNKGLYQQSLALLESAKIKAKKLDNYTMLFEIIEFEKLIETQYITRSLKSRADDLAIEAKHISQRNLMLSKLSNLSLQLYSFLLQNGYVKDEEDANYVSQYFYDKLPTYHLKDMGFKEKLFLYQAMLWYSQIQQDFKSSYRHAVHWIELFDVKLAKSHPIYYLKALNSVLDSLYYLRYLSKFETYFSRLESLPKIKNITKNTNIASTYFIYYNFNRINRHFLRATFAEGILEIKEIEFGIKKHESTLDQHHLMVFYYKFACLYFGESDHENCIYYLRKIIGTGNLKIREDLNCYARILHLIASYELGEEENLEKLITQTYRFLLKMNDLHLVQKEIIYFLRSLSDLFPHEIYKALKILLEKLKAIENHPYEKRSFLYLDIISWLEAKLSDQPIKVIIKEKATLLR